MCPEPEIVSLTSTLLAAVVPRRRTTVRASEAAPHGPAHAHGATVTCLCDVQGRVLYITPNAREVLGEACERAAEFSLSLGALLQPEDPEDVDRLIQRFVQTDRDQSMSADLLTRAPTGNPRWLELWCRNLMHHVAIAAYLIEIRDVTYKREDDKLRIMLSAAMQHLPESVIVTDTAGVIRYVNPGFERLTGFDSNEAIGSTPALLKSGQHNPEFYRKLWRTVSAGDTWQGEICNRRKNGEEYFEHVLIAPVRDAQGLVSYFLSVGRDISARKAGEEDALELACYDAQTGLPRLRLLHALAPPLLSSAGLAGAALMRIRIEDTDSDVLDTALTIITSRLQAALSGAAILGRVDEAAEFVILRPSAGKADEIAALARELQGCVCQVLGLNRGAASVAVGVALFPQDGDTFEQLYAHAGAALLRVADSGAAVEFVDRHITDVSSDIGMLERDLDWAMERRQFMLQFQPVFALPERGSRRRQIKPGQLVGLTALPRWPHLERGIIEHAQFSSLIERAGYGADLDAWAVRKVMQEAEGWSARGWKGWLSLRLSAHSLRVAGSVDLLLSNLRTHGISAGRFVVRVAADTIWMDLESSLNVLQKLSNAGVQIALDIPDLQRAPLTLLRSIPVDTLFFAPGWSHSAEPDVRERLLVEAAVGFAHRMGVRCVATELDEQRELEWLQSAGCDFVQGRFLSEAASAETVTSLLV